MSKISWGPATILVMVIAVIVVAVGGVLCIVEPKLLTFEEYTTRLVWMASAAGALGIGRGIYGFNRPLIINSTPNTANIGTGNDSSKSKSITTNVPDPLNRSQGT